jgi:tetratricopeptide (TPR) repeat protein
MSNFDEVAKLITEKWELISAVGEILAKVLGASGVVGFVLLLIRNRRRSQRLLKIPAGDFPFEVIPPRSSDLIKKIMGGDDKNPLADYKIPYQERQRDRSIRQELEQVFTEKNWILILGKSGLGKTREAAHLADVLNQEGWTVLKLADQPEEWLDVPRVFPSKISKDDRLLFFLDDLNRWTYAGNPNEIHPKAGEDLARPLREPVQERLSRLLQYFENQCKSVRVLATARDEREPDKLGQISPWEKLQWEKYKIFWDNFTLYELVEPDESSLIQLLTDCVAAAGLRGMPEEYGQIARRNDGTFRNITANLDSACNRGLAVSDKEFSPRLNETWRQRYNKAVQRHPLAKYVYDAVELLQALNFPLTEPMLAKTSKLLLIGRWWRIWQLQQALQYVVKTEQILIPKDGQVEGKKTGTLDVNQYSLKVARQVGKMAKQYPIYCLTCGIALLNTGRYEEAFTVCDEAVKVKHLLSWSSRSTLLIILWVSRSALLKKSEVDEECEKVVINYLHCAWLSRSRALEKLHRYEEAIASYDHAVALKPDEHNSWSTRGNLLYELARYEEAVGSYDHAVRVKPDDYSSWHLRGVALEKLKRYEESVDSYDHAAEINPSYHYTWFHRGIALGKLKRYEESVDSYDHAVKIQPDNHTYWDSQGTALRELRRYEEAIASYDKAVQLKPDYHFAWFFRGIALVAMNRYEEALTSYNQAVEIAPNFDNAWYVQGVVLGNLKRYEEAITSYDKAIEIKPDNHISWNARGTAFYELERLEEAIASYDKAINLNPDFYDAWRSRGIALDRRKQHEEAIASYDKALVINPDDYIAWYARGIALVNLKSYEEAIVSYDKAVEIKPDDHSYWHSRGNALRELGCYEKAIVSYDKAVKIKADAYSTWYLQGVSLGNLKRYEEAITSYDKAVEIKPDNHNSWNAKGTALYELGRYEEAIVSYDQAAQLNPDFYQAWRSRGMALDKLKQYEEAIVSYDKALEIKPDDYLAWSVRGNAFYALKRYEQALENYDRATHIRSDYHAALYNIACCYGLQSKVEQSLENLQRAIQINDTYRRKAVTASAFNLIRSDPQFQALLNSTN